MKTKSSFGSKDFIETVLDPGSFTSWDTPIPQGLFPQDYEDQLEASRVRAGTDEALITGEARIRGRRLAVVISEFNFLAGSIGVNAAERLRTAIERATATGVPLLAAPASGGTRMQEGTPAFVGMINIAAAITKHRSSGLPYLVYLRNPVTGGVMASWGSLGHVTMAEPGALVGFLGPRVYEALHGKPFPTGVQTSENLYRHGLIDRVLTPEELPRVINRLLSVMTQRSLLGTIRAPLMMSPEPEEKPSSAWQSVLMTRDPARPGARELLQHAASDVEVLHGTGAGEKDPGLLLAFARFGQARCVFIAHDRTNQGPNQGFGPGALREVRRGIRLAEELDLPIVTVIDTPGATLSKASEEAGLATEIAQSIARLASTKAITVSVLLGEGTGGGALALLPADYTLAAENAWLAPLPPEGASAIVHRSTAKAPEMAEAHRISARDLRDSGVVDWIIPEFTNEAEPRSNFSSRTGEALERAVLALEGQHREHRLATRQAKYTSSPFPQPI